MRACPNSTAALSENLFATTQKVLNFADGDAKREIQALLMKWDLVNLKTIAVAWSVGAAQTPF